MYLLQIKQNSKFRSINRVSKLIDKLKNKFNFLKQLNFKVKTINYAFVMAGIKQSLIEYIVTFSALKTNTLLFVTNVTGHLKFLFTAGNANVTGKQKTRKPLVLLNLLRLLNKKLTLVSTSFIALHFKNFKKQYGKFVTRVLKKKLFIKVWKNFKRQPHNGCRPRKLRRK